MGRLKRVERDVGALERTLVQISEVVVDLAERVGRGFRRSDDRLDLLGERFGDLSERFGDLSERFGGLGARLERLIAVTLDERTASTHRLRDIEQRLSRLEDRVGPG